MIVNLTQHPATSDQMAAGVVDLPHNKRQSLIEALTFNLLPNEQEIERRAEIIAELAVQNGLGGDDEDPLPEAAMIGGAPWLMGPLAEELRARWVRAVFAFSVRETEEQVQPDGSVRKVSVFRHAGFVPYTLETDMPRVINKCDFRPVATFISWSQVQTFGCCSHAFTAGYYADAKTSGTRSSAMTAGNRSNASATGLCSNAVSTGDESRSNAGGECAVAAALGRAGMAKAGHGGAIVLCYRNDIGDLIHIRAAKVGQDGIEPDTWYMLDEDGEFVSCGKHSDAR